VVHGTGKGKGNLIDNETQLILSLRVTLMGAQGSARAANAASCAASHPTTIPAT
jgi:hypothetical protein